jgi:hypothetical protein
LRGAFDRARLSNASITLNLLRLWSSLAKLMERPRRDDCEHAESQVESLPPG